MTFDMKERIPQDAVLALGGAIDGGQAIFDVEWPFVKQALLRLERHIVILLRAHQYTPKFG